MFPSSNLINMYLIYLLIIFFLNVLKYIVFNYIQLYYNILNNYIVF